MHRLDRELPDQGPPHGNGVAAQQGAAPGPTGAPMPPTPWMVDWRVSARPDATLIAFPHAGGTASMVRPWLDMLPSPIDLIAIQYPGRETRFGETPFERADLLAETIAEAIAARLTRPVHLFGHSMGALLAFLVARRLAASGGPAVEHLIVAGRRAPQLADPFEPAHDLPTDAFIARLKQLGGTPAAVFEHPELMQMLLPMLRADFAVSETYRHDDATPSPCPVTALGGLRDPMATPDELHAWARQAPAGFAAHLFEGGHFFIRTAQAAVLDRIVAIVGGPPAGTEPKVGS